MINTYCLYVPFIHLLFVIRIYICLLIIPPLTIIIILQCCLLEQMNREPPIRGRARRWFSVLTDATWPEVLRRYLIATKVEVAATEDTQEGGEGVEGDEDDDENTSATPGQMTKEERKKELELLTAASMEPLEGDPLAMDDRQLAVHCAALLNRGAWWEVPAAAHLRLLGMLCYDIAQGQNLREDINTRVADCTKLQADWAKEAAAAKRQQKRAADGGNDGGRAKRRRSIKKGTPGAPSIDDAGGPSTAEGGDEGDKVDGEGTGWKGEEGIGTGRDAEYEAQLEHRAYRTDPLGLDRHSRRYWWLRGTPSHIFIENQEGAPAGAISTQEQVDDLLAKLNRRGPRESELYHNLRHKYDTIVASFAAEQLTASDFNVFTLPRPTPTDGRVRQKDLPTLAAMAGTTALTDAREQIEAFITETQDIDVTLGVELKTLRKELRACETPAALCDYLLHLERYYCGAGEGLPQGADNEHIAVLLGEEDAVKLPEVILPPSAIAALEEAAAEEKERQREREAAEQEKKAAIVLENGARAGGDVNEAMETETGTVAAGGAASNGVNPAMPAVISAGNGSPDEAMPDAQMTNVDGSIAAEKVAAATNTGAPAPAAAGVKEEEDEEAPLTQQEDDADDDDENITAITPGHHTGTTNGTAAVPLPNPVTVNDEFDDSDAEHAYLREKRMRKPARLWRSARERAVWLKTVLQAKRAADQGSCGASAQTAYCAHMLFDRGSKMLKVAAKLAEDVAKWEEAEAARARAEANRPGVQHQQAAGPSERPLMIRTGKSKTEDGMKVILKAMGKEVFPQGRQSTAEAPVADEVIAGCRWGYQCSVCMLAGDLLCCEHPDGCVISVHPQCTGLPFPQGAWVCSNHDDRRLKGRIRRQRSFGRSIGGDDDSDLTVSEDTESANSEVNSDDEDVGSRRRSRR